MANILEIKNLVVSYGGIEAVKGIDLTVEEGKIVTLVGSNGAGKSTTLNAIAGAFPIDSGSILIDGVDVSRMPEYKRAAFIGRVFQDPMRGTAAGMMISENLAIADLGADFPDCIFNERVHLPVTGTAANTLDVIFKHPGSLKSVKYLRVELDCVEILRLILCSGNRTIGSVCDNSEARSNL